MGLRLDHRLALLLATLGVGLMVPHAPAQSPALREIEPNRIVSEEVTALSRQLSEASDVETRIAAARRLISIGTSEARNAVLFTLRDPSPQNIDGRLAAARAVAEDLPPDPRFVDALFVLFDAGQRRDILDAAVIALGNHKASADVNARLIRLTGAGSPDTVRIAAARALGHHAEKAGAARLIELTDDANPQVAFAAVEALQTLASLQLTTAGDWINWWKAQSSLSPDAFRDEMLVARVALLEQEKRQRGDEAMQEQRRNVVAAIAGATNDQRGDILNRYLTSSRDSVRIIAIEEAYQLATTGDLPASSRPVIRSMLSDPERGIRFQAARTISRVNDIEAFEPIIRQIAIESDSGVKMELAGALGVIGNLDAVPTLRWLLDDASTSVVQASATALAKIGPALVDKDPTAAAELGYRIRALLDQIPRTPGNVRQREALIAAIVPLKQQSMASVFAQMLTADPREPERIRRLAAAGLGQIGDPNWAELLAEVMNDTLASTPAVRLEAMNALGKVANSFSVYANALYTRMDAKFESDPDIRAAAWTVLTKLFVSASREQLAAWPEKSLIRGDAAKELQIYLALAEKALAANDQDEYVQRLEQIGDTYMALGEAAIQPERDEQFIQATSNFRKALDLTRAANGPAGQIERLIGSTVRSMLRARQYAEAAAFTSELLADPANQQYQVIVGPQFRQEAERLTEAAGQSEDALALIRAALAIRPSLANIYVESLRTLQQNIETRGQQKNQFATPEFMQQLAQR